MKLKLCADNVLSVRSKPQVHTPAGPQMPPAPHWVSVVQTMPALLSEHKATWKLTGVNQTTGSSSVAACVGPGDVTVTQTKIFSNSGSSLSF